MQVTHTEDHVTHAVIGGAKQIDMGISDSAEFFHILSSTLYSDQKLAVVRETVCNAWDAHIDSNRKDKAISINVTNEAITIRDYGFGIPKDLIGPIYGVYGASTKKNDGNATGGFGLGCKSPFAYTDNFQVTSFCNGVRTIYNMSKSSAVVNGKPSIVPIASFPTTETGLEVVIRLTESSHAHHFRNLFKRIIWNGGIRATMNDVAMNTLKTYAITDKFFMTDYDVLEKRTSIAISYGNVIYPLDEHSQYSSLYREAAKVCQVHTNQRYNSHFTLVLIAPPNSISVTPSRESLSMQSHTTDTAKLLLQNFLALASKSRKDMIIPIIRDSVEQATKKKLFDSLLTDHSKLPVTPAKTGTKTNDFTVFNFAHLTKLHYSNQYPVERDAFDFKLRVSELMKAKHTPAGLGQSFLRAYAHTRKSIHRPSNWANKHVIRPMLRKMQSVPTMLQERLLIIGIESRYNRETQIHKAMGLGTLPLQRSMPLLRNVIIVSYTRKDIDSRLRFAEDMSNYGREGATLLYVVARSQPRVDEALEFFKTNGYRVIDLTKPLKGEHHSAVTPIKPREPSKARSVGLPLLANGTAPGRDNFRAANFWEDNLPRITEPEFIVLCTDTNDGRQGQKLNEFSGEISQLIAKYFGSTGAVVKTRVQETSYIKKGAKDVYEYLIPKVCAYIQNCPLINAQISSKLEIADDIYDGRSTLINKLNANPLALASVGLMAELSVESKDYMRMWSILANKINNLDVTTTANYLKNIPQSLDAKTLSQGIENSAMAHYVDSRELVFGLQSKNPINQTAALKLLQFVIT